MKAKLILPIVAISLLTGTAAADSITMTFNGLQGGGIGVKVVHPTGSVNTAAGRFNWTQQGTGRTLHTFCTELTEFVSGGNQVTYECRDVADMPSSFQNGMGQLRADLIGELYDNHYDDAVAFNGGGGGFSDMEQAAAFQFAIWEIVYEGNLDDGLDSGDLNVSNGEGDTYMQNTDADAVALANTWLGELTGVLDPNGRYHHLLVGLANDGKQDQLLIIPLPPAVAMAGLGLLGVVAVRRRLVAKL